MGGWTRGFMAGVAMLAMPAIALPQPPAPALVSATSQVRSRSSTLLSVVARAGEMSPTFRSLVEIINANDSIVFLEPGPCRNGVLACLVTVDTVAGQRVFFVKVSVKRSERELMPTIGHELRHVIELLSDQAVTNYSSMYFFYKLKGDRPGTSTSYETNAAVRTGEAIAREIRQFERAKATE
jgi:hypothetical protein